MGNAKHRLDLRNGIVLSAYRRKHRGIRRTSRAIADCPDADFDVDAWMAVVEEQKLAIARAAGVDSGKVRIQIGH